MTDRRSPRATRGGETLAPTLWERFVRLVTKPPDPGAPGRSAPRALSADELTVAARAANDKERLVGLIAAPVAAAIGFLIIEALIANDPAARLRDGAVDKLHVSVGLYEELLVVLLVLAALALAFALLRKRMYLGLVLALYGLAVFNLHYWGFGVPFVMVGAWLLVRAYRFQRDLRAATGGPPARPRAGGAGGSSRSRASKRYTPPKRSA